MPELERLGKVDFPQYIADVFFHWYPPLLIEQQMARKPQIRIKRMRIPKHELSNN